MFSTEIKSAACKTEKHSSKPKIYAENSWLLIPTIESLAVKAAVPLRLRLESKSVFEQILSFSINMGN